MCVYVKKNLFLLAQRKKKVNVCIYMCAYMYVYKYICICVHSCMYIHIHVCVRVYKCMYTYYESGILTEATLVISH